MAPNHCILFISVHFIASWTKTLHFNQLQMHQNYETLSFNQQ